MAGKPKKKPGRYDLEHRGQKPISSAEFRYRLFYFLLLALLVISVSLGIGMLGYHYLADLAWIDAFLNASMILGGMGPVDEMTTPASKIFASLYAIFSGVIFLATASILFAPIYHRMLHNFHFDEQDVEEEPDEAEDDEAGKGGENEERAESEGKKGQRRAARQPARQPARRVARPKR